MTRPWMIPFFGMTHDVSHVVIDPEWPHDTPKRVPAIHNGKDVIEQGPFL